MIRDTDITSIFNQYIDTQPSGIQLVTGSCRLKAVELTSGRLPIGMGVAEFYDGIDSSGEPELRIVIGYWDGGVARPYRIIIPGNGMRFDNLFLSCPGDVSRSGEAGTRTDYLSHINVEIQR